METKVQSLGVAGMSTLSSGATDAIELGEVLFLPELAFAVALPTLLLIAAAAAVAKNVSFDGASGRLKGVREGDAAYAKLHEAMASFADFSFRNVTALLPRYQGALQIGRTSFRPAEIAGRRTSWRKDDTRLHIDSFPSTPVHGRRILRFFSNVNPHGRPRRWRIAAPLPQVAPRFLPRLRPPLPGSAALLAALGVTRTRRSAYDHYMLQLHDAMKRDARFQSDTAQVPFDFPAESSWLVYTDLVPHAAMSGRLAFEQTFYLPVERMQDPEKSPQRALEALLQRLLV